MPRHADPVLTVAEMRSAEQALIDVGETVDSLMLRAGRGAADWIWRLAGRDAVTVLCGPGNNGGDGYVIAQTLRERGTPVTVVAPLEPGTAAARNARAAWRGPVLAGGPDRGGTLLVDCLFGSGLTRPLSDDLAGLLGELARRHRRLVAVDLPSGIEADSGALLNHALPRCDLTLALGAWKQAHWLQPGAAQMGALRLVPIGIGPQQGGGEVLARPRLTVPERAAHKYSRGLLAIVGGAMPGAGLLAAQAAQAGGAGYVRLLAQAAVPGAPADLVVDHALLGEALADERYCAVLIGPGLGRDGLALRRLEQALTRDLPTVLDADALVLLTPGQLATHRAPLIATPHAGELAQLCRAFGIAEKGKLEQARALARASGMVVVAKGPDTLIAAPDGRTMFCPPASSWLSAAGTGDVLAGLVASRLASGQDAFHAAAEAVWLHGEAARLAGPVLSASALAAQLPRAYAACL